MNPAPSPVQSDEAETETELGEAPRSRKWKFRIPKIPSFTIRGVNRKLSATLSFLTRALILVLIAIGTVFIYRELSGSNYSIEQFTVPKSFEESGYTGQVIANRLFNRVDAIVRSERLADVANEYKNANSTVDLNVELVGIGVPIRSFIAIVGEALGIDNRKTVSGNMVLDGDTLVFELNVDGEVEKFQTPFADNIERPMAAVIERSAETVLKHTSPYVLARHYLLRDAEGSFQLGRYILSKHENNPDVEPIGYFAVAGGHYTNDDFAAAEEVIRAGIIKYENDLNLHAALSTMIHRQKRYDEAIAQCKKIIGMLDEHTPVNRVCRSYMNLSYVLGDLNRWDSAMHYATIASKIDKDFIDAYVYTGELYVRKGDTTRALDNWRTAFEKGLRVSDYRRMMRNQPKILEDPRVIGIMSNARKEF